MAVRFDAESDGYQAAHSGTTYTALCWVRLVSDRNAFSTIFDVSTSTSSFMQFGTNADGVTLGVHTHNGGEDVGTLVVGSWFRVAVVCNAGTITCYMGAETGALAASLSVTPGSYTPTTLRIGKSVWSGEFADCRIASFKMWSTALTAAQLELEFAQYQPIVALDTLTRFYPLFSHSLADESGRGNTLTLGTTTPTTEDGPPIRFARSRGPRVTFGGDNRSGSAAADMRFTATATGSKAPASSRAADMRLTASSVATARTGASSATAPMRFTASAAGGRAVTGSATATMRFTAAATGQKINAATAIMRFTASGPGVHAGAGSTTAPLRLTATSTGTGAHAGARTGTLRLTATSSATSARSATASATLRLTATAVGAENAQGGAVEATMRFAASASGGRFTAEFVGRASLTVPYELVCVARVQQASGPPLLLEIDAIEWTSLTWSSTLSRPQELTATCPASSITPAVAQRLRDPVRQPMELWLDRDGQRVFAGPLTGWHLRGNDVDITASGLLSYLQWMLVVATNTAEPLSLRFDQVDQHLIAAALIDQWQALPYRNLGVDTSTVAPSGRLRDRSYVRSERHQVGQRVEELGKVLDGFDVEVNAVTRKLELWYPGKGSDRSDAVVFDEQVITTPDVMCSVAPGDVATIAFGTSSTSGADTTLWSEQVNAELLAVYGGAAVAESFSDISEQATLDEHVLAVLDARDQALLVPGPRMRVTPDVDLKSYDVGDRVAIEMDAVLGVSGAYRIRKRAVRVEASGQELVDLELV